MEIIIIFEFFIITISFGLKWQRKYYFTMSSVKCYYGIINLWHHCYTLKIMVIDIQFIWVSYNLIHLFSNRKIDTFCERNGDLPGHCCTLQSLVWVELPEHDPVEFSSTNFVRLLVLDPPPQSFEHSEYGPQEFHSQLTI